MFGNARLSRIQCFFATLILSQSVLTGGQLFNSGNELSLHEYNYVHPTNKEEMVEFRLPQNVKPKSYALTVETNFETFTIKGSVKIDVKLTEDVKQIKLNAKDLNITSVTVESKYENSNLDIKFECVPKNEQLIITHAKGFSFHAIANHTININYTAPLRNDMTGFYKSSYVQNGEKK